MKNIIVLFRSFFQKGRNNIIKILSLGIGLAVGLVLIAKVYFDQSFDDFFPDKERIYRVQMLFKMGEDEGDSPRTSGGVAPGFKSNIPEIEAATRYTTLFGNDIFYTEDKSKYKANIIMADNGIFDVFELPVLTGNAKEVLARPMYVMVSRKIAENMGGISKAMEQTIQLDTYPGKTLTIGGVFEDLPQNSHLNYNLIISMPSISQFTYDGTENWLGNDRYYSYVKLYPGANPSTFGPQIDDIKKKFLPLKEMKDMGIELDYVFIPMLDIHAGSKDVKRMDWLLGLLAFALLFTAVLNYVLIVISSLVNRSKEMAVYKCYGASGGNIHRRMLSETLFDLFISLILATLLILLFRGTIQSLLNESLGALFTPQSFILLVGICVLVFLISGLIPGYLFSHVPVAAAFRRYSESRRFWKLGLLFIQFIGAGLFITLLFIIVNQYNYMVTDDPGYKVNDIAYCSLSGVEAEMRKKALEEVARMPEVKEVTTAASLLFIGASGNNIGIPGSEEDLFNIADLYSVGNDYLKFMGIPLIEGESFRENISSSDEVMVSRSFIDKILLHTDWKDGVVGKAITISEHGGKPYTICGVFEDIRLGTIGRQDVRPTVMFYNERPSEYLLVKFHNLTPQNILHVSDLLSTLMPTNDIVVNSYQAELVNRYRDSRQFRDQVIIGGIVTLLICLIGLLGYTSDEMNRRRKETAIRKVNGATIADILRLFIKDISWIALPALVLGGIASFFIANRWLEQFPQQASFTVFNYIFCGIMVLAIILFAVSLKSFRAATENPAENVKSE